MANTVGTILGVLKLDRSEWSEEIQAAQAEADNLGRSNPKISIKTNAAEAITQLAAVAAATKRLQDAQGQEAVAQQRLTELRAKDNVAQSRILKAEQDLERAHRGVAVAVTQLAAAYQGAGEESQIAEKNVKALSSALLLVGSAAVPLAAVAAGALAGLAGTAAVAVAGILGIRDAMQQGTDLGQKYKSAFSGVRAEFDTIKRTAAAGMFDGINSAIKSSEQLFPLLNKDVLLFSTQIGNIASHAAPGLVSLFTRMNPLFITFGNQLEHGAANFQNWAQSSQGVTNFVAYVQSSLPGVESTLAALITAAGHAAQAFEPFGTTTLQTLRTFADVLNAIPVPVLQAIVPLLAGLKIGNTFSASINNAGRSLEGLGDKLTRSNGFASDMGASVGKAGKLVSGLGIAGTLAGVALGGLSLAMGQQRRAAEEEQKQVNALTQAILDGTAASAVWANAQQTGADAATKYGVTQSQLVAALSGSKQQYDTLQAKLKGLSDAHDKLAQSTIGQLSQNTVQIEQERKAGDAIDGTRQAVAKSREEYEKAKTALADYLKKKGDESLANEISNGSFLQHAKALGLDADTYVSAKTAVDQKIKSDKDAAAQQKILIAQNYQLAGTQDDLSKVLGISTQQVQQYASMLGITQDQVAKGLVSAQGYAMAVDQVANAENNATQAGSAFLGALQQFSQSAGTAADRAALIGATLKAANGDNLNFATAMNGSAVASKGLADSLAQAASQVGKNGESVSAYMASIVNLKNGTIDYNNAAAAPLIQGLNQIQSAALTAAQAQYQHEVATKGGKAAADDAYKTYVGQTQGSLIDQASKLGLTTAQAKKLADQYFGMPKDVKTKIEQEGASPIVTILSSIRSILGAIARSWGIDVSANTGGATGPIARVQAQLQALKDKHVRITSDIVTNYIQTGNKQAAGSAGTNLAKADGGPISGPGTGTSDSIPAMLSNGEFVVNAKQAAKYRGLLEAINSGKPAGYAGGGTVGGKYYSSAASYHNALTALGQQQAQVRLTLDTRGLPGVMRALGGSTSGLNSSLRTLVSELQQADRVGIASTPFVQSIARENAALSNEAKKRDGLAAQYKAAQQKLSAVLQSFGQERSKVSQAFTGSFSITSGGGDAADIITGLQGDVNSARAFNSLLARLKSQHLNSALLDQLASAGPGSANALALRGASNAQIAAINKLYGQLGSTGNAAGNTVANAMYSAGINAAKGLENGIKSQMASLNRTMASMAKSLLAQVKRTLGIRSPSTEMHLLGAFTGMGFEGGMASRIPHIQRVASQYGSTAKVYASNRSKPVVGGPSAAGAAAPNVRVFIGDRELTDMIRVEVDGHADDLANQLVYGRAS